MKVKRRVCSAALTLAMTLSLLVTMVLPAGAVGLRRGQRHPERSLPHRHGPAAEELPGPGERRGPGPVRQPHRQRRSGRPGLGPIGLSSSGYVGTLKATATPFGT